MDGRQFRELVRKARSTRRFDESDPISEEEVRELVDTARVAPCGGNQQPLKYRLIVEPEERRRVFPHVKWAGALKDWDGPAEGERPTAYIAVLSEEGTSPDTTIGIAGQTIQLGAASMGYAACMLGAIDRKAIQDELGVPADMTLHLLVALGKPGETVTLEDMPKDGTTSYWRTDDGVHHVPKRSLSDVLIPSK